MKKHRFMCDHLSKAFSPFHHCCSPYSFRYLFRALLSTIWFLWYAVYPYLSIKKESLAQVDGAHVSRSFNLSPARNPFDRPEGGEQQWRQGKNAFDKWSHVQLRFFMKWFLLWYTYALLLGENLLAKMAFQNIVVVSEGRLPILCMGRRKPGLLGSIESEEGVMKIHVQ